MKTGLDHLPKHKAAEILKITSFIKEVVPAELIILFGSYARGDWIEEMYDEEHYRYQSDYDLLVIVEETKSGIQQRKFEQDIELKIEQDQAITTPVSIILHDIGFINKRLKRAQYFFTDIIKKDGILLFDSGKHQLSEAREVNSEERKKLAQEDFDYWFKGAEEFFLDFNNAFNRGSYTHAAFLLHQTTENLYNGILLVFTRYKPNTHDLLDLRRLANSVDSRLVKIFPFGTQENHTLFKLLRKAYVDARYNPNYLINAKELDQLSLRVKELRDLGELICNEKINSF